MLCAIILRIREVRIKIQIILMGMLEAIVMNRLSIIILKEKERILRTK